MTSSLIGRTLGKYEITEIVGRGGMATVYKGYHRELDRYLAIKVLPPRPELDSVYIERFRREARTIARLQHPHILSLYDYGVEDDIFYLAMGYASGGSLRDLLNKGRPSPSHTEQLLRDVGSALDYAHRQGVIHRDIKPGNILIDGEGHALLVDFGIAKLTGVDVSLTNTGSVVGTPAYIAPEQSQGQPIDARADIYSLGVVAYEMLTGHQPFGGTNMLQVIMQHVQDPVPTLGQPDLPLGLDAVIQCVMAKTPGERYQTATEFVEALGNALHSADAYIVAQPEVAVDKIADDESSEKNEATVILTVKRTAGRANSRSYAFLFTDIEGSTQLWDETPQEMSAALALHDKVLSETVRAYYGKIFKTTADRVFAVFESSAYALQAALTIQQTLHQGTTLRLPVRIAIHFGEAESRANIYFGKAPNVTTLLLEAAHGGQILLSAETKAQLPRTTELLDLGQHHLPDVTEALHIFQAWSANFPLISAPLRTLTPRPTNLPAQLSSFVGRQRDLLTIGQLLHQPMVRLLTLVGPGGIGKTRLSIQLGQSLLNEYEHGVYFISLMALNHRDAILSSLAKALNIQEDTTPALIETIKAFLKSRQTLLIFDNFEHILEAAPFINDILVSAPHVKVLVTSREALFIYGERIHTVSPLDLPAINSSIDTTLQSSAAALFVERVQAIQSDFILSDDNIQHIVNICRQLEGLPLALELAAARVLDLMLPEIAEQLTQRLTLLSKGPRDLPLRQQTMRGAIEWSYQLLPTEQQQAFARLAVFEGQFYAEAGQTVSGLADISIFKNKSLLQQNEESIYAMLAVLREYAMERLVELNERVAAQQAHANYYNQWLGQARNFLNSRNQVEWYQRLAVEQYNLQAALSWSVQNNIEGAAQMGGVLWRYWAAQSLLSEGQQWLNQILARADSLSPLSHAEVTQGAGRLALLRHDYARADTLQQTSLPLYKTLNHLPGQAAVLLSLGETEFAQGNLSRADAYIADSLQAFRLLDDQAGIGRCIKFMGMIAVQNGDFAKAELLLRESLALSLEHGSSEGIALVLYSLGNVLRTQEKFTEAEDCYRQSLALYHELDFAVGIATMLTNLGFALQGQGNYIGAAHQFLDALKMLQDLEEPTAMAECLIGIASIYFHLQKPYLCVQTLSAANALLTSLNAQGELDHADQIQYDRLYAAAHLEEEERQAAWASGQSTPAGQLIRAIFDDFKANSILDTDV